MAGPALRFMDHIYAPEQRYLKYLLLFVLLKTANRALNRLAMNNGWRSDKPKFSLVKGQGDVLVITGGSTGIGKDFVEILSKKSGNIAVLDLAEPTYKAKNVTFYQCDVTDPAAIKVVADKIRKELGEPSIMINNAGIARGKTILATTPFEFLLTYKVRRSRSLSFELLLTRTGEHAGNPQHAPRVSPAQYVIPTPRHC